MGRLLSSKTSSNILPEAELLPFECSASGRMLDEVLLLRRRPIDSSVFHGEAEARIPRRDPGWRRGLLVYLDLALIFLLLRFSLRIRFLRHLARIVPARRVVHSSSHTNERGRRKSSVSN